MSAVSSEVRRMTYREAVRDGLRAALLAHPEVFLMGEDIGRYGGCFAVTKGLLEEFGEARIRDTPLSESAFVGAGIGAALGGLRPIVEIMTVNFSLLALDQNKNTAATLNHMSGGQWDVPLIIRMATGAGRQVAAQHSHSLEGWYSHIPGWCRGHRAGGGATHRAPHLAHHVWGLAAQVPRRRRAARGERYRCRSHRPAHAASAGRGDLHRIGAQDAPRAHRR